MTEKHLNWPPRVDLKETQWHYERHEGEARKAPPGPGQPGSRAAVDHRMEGEAGRGGWAFVRPGQDQSGQEAPGSLC